MVFFNVFRPNFKENIIEDLMEKFHLPLYTVKVDTDRY